MCVNKKACANASQHIYSAYLAGDFSCLLAFRQLGRVYNSCWLAVASVINIVYIRLLRVGLSASIKF
jgi:hypothetical protein